MPAPCDRNSQQPTTKASHVGNAADGEDEARPGDEIDEGSGYYDEEVGVGCCAIGRYRRSPNRLPPLRRSRAASRRWVDVSVLRPKIAHALKRFVPVVLALTGLAAIVGVIFMTVGAAGSYRDAVAGAIWFIGFMAALVVAGQLIGEILAWDSDERDTPESESDVRLILIPAGVVVIAIGTIVYVLF